MGTPISPMLTNLIMIPFDYELSKYLRSLYKPENNSDRRGRRFVYTRYADDMHISCRIDFDWKAVQREIHRIFKRFGAPYVMKAEKTHYGSRSGQNWMLGIMLNKDNKMTIGHKKKRQFEAMLHNYLKDRAEGRSWENGALFYMQGVISYYRMVNEAETNDVLRAYGERHNLDIEKCVKDDLAAG